MKKIIIGIVIASLLILAPSQSDAKTNDLKIELVRTERAHSTFPESDTINFFVSDTINFFVNVTNESQISINGRWLTARIPDSKEYKASDGIFTGRLIETILPGQTVLVEVGSYLVPRSKKLSGKIEFVLSNTYASPLKEFKKLQKFTSSFSTVPLKASEDTSWEILTIKTIPSDTKKSYSKGKKDAKLYSFTLESTTDFDLTSPIFSYLYKKVLLKDDELLNITLWSGKTLVCGPEQLTKSLDEYQAISHYMAFDNCIISLTADQRKKFTIKADISKNVPKNAVRNISLTGYGLSETLEVNNEGYQSKDFKFK